jgi:putative salt-induced outer membrane protein YdiY
MNLIKGLLLAVLIAAPVAGQAQEEAAATNKLWKSNLSVGATYKNGNSEKSLFTMNLRADRFGEHHDIINTLYAEYGQTGTPTSPSEQTEGQIRGQSEYRHKFGDSKWFGGVFGEARNDAIKQIRIRAKIGPVIGYYFIDKENMKLDATFGVNYVYERTAANGEDDYGEYRAAANYLWNITDKSDFYFNIEYSADIEMVDERNSGLLVTGVRSAVYESLFLFIELRDEYDNLPAPGTKHNDETIIAGLSYDF